MMKIFKNKKGINDISIISLILFIFVLTAIMIPFVNAEFGTNADIQETETTIQNIKDGGDSITTISAFGVLASVGKLAVFDFGNTLGLPFWMDITYTVLAVIFILVVARNVWIGGGA